MEHEVYVPFSVGSVRAALADWDRVARCVPGLQLDAADRPEQPPGESTPGGGPPALAGRLRVRIGGSTITYRGNLLLTPRDDGLSVAGTGNEARGNGAAELSLTLAALRSADGEGTRLVCSGSLQSAGRLAEFGDRTVRSTGQRLMDRFAAALGETLVADPPGAAPGQVDGPLDQPAPHDEPASPEADRTAADGTVVDGTDAEGTRPDGTSGEGGGIGEPDDNERAIPGIPNPEADGDSRPEHPEVPDHASVFDTEIPEPSLDPLSGEADDTDVDDTDTPSAAEAAHARRTMIGRSAEEVDHAPPKGRYAPIPAPEAAATTATLRWAAPAAAAVVAGAIVLTRTLRRRG